MVKRKFWSTHTHTHTSYTVNFIYNTVNSKNLMGPVFISKSGCLKSIHKGLISNRPVCSAQKISYDMITTRLGQQKHTHTHTSMWAHTHTHKHVGTHTHRACLA